MSEEFDFSKIEDQKKFEELPKENQEDIIGEAQDEAKYLENKRRNVFNALVYGDIGKALRIMDRHDLPIEAVRRIVQESIIYCLSKDRTGTALEISNQFNLPKETVHQAAKQTLINFLSKGHLRDALKIKDTFNLPDEVISSNEIQEAAKQGIIYCLLEHGFDGLGSASEIKSVFYLPKEMVYQAAKQGMVGWLLGGEFGHALRIKNEFNLPDEVISSNEIQEAAKQAFIDRLSGGNLDVAMEIKDNFKLPRELLFSSEVQEAAKQRMIDDLSRGYVTYAIEVKDTFNLPDAVMSLNEVKQAAKYGIINSFSEGHYENALEIEKEFTLPEGALFSDEIQQAAKQGFIHCLSRHYFAGLALDIQDVFCISGEVVQQLSKQGFIDCLSRGDISRAQSIKDNSNLPDAVMSSNEVKQAAMLGIIDCLLRGNIDDAQDIQRAFSITIQPAEILKELPDMNEFLDKIKATYLNLYSQILKSTELLIGICNFRNNPHEFFEVIKENPFLTDAVAENPRFGSRMLIKYPQFDGLSKENIQALFAAKKEILGNNPDIDPESSEFRQLMQEKLKEYKNNPKILQAIEENGVNVNEWLNYSEISYFNLESSGEHLAFSETIATPIARIKETLDRYVHTLKNILKEYRPELSEFKIPLGDTKEIEAKISQMQMESGKARAEGNEKKAQGIERGVESLKKKIETIKTVSVWAKLVGDIDAFQLLKGDVFGAQEKLIQAENDLQKKLSGKTPSGRMIQEAKEKLNKAKEELRSKFGVLETRIENFKTNIPKLLIPALGKDRAESLIQEIEQGLAEQFNHYSADRNTLANIFSERSDKEKNELENQPMSIFVWTRNPDIDLYQGNYSPCCICIDSEHMGAESTIADYNTDLGIQIVNIWDETKNVPVTAAWCWLGKDTDGNSALVVDNIESNTAYSANYSEQLTKELFDYFKNYAISIGVKKVVLGKANNDLPTAGELVKMKEDDGRYGKLGGFNRIDGYFLEAEDGSVKLIWQAEKKTEKTKKKEKTEIPRIKFDNIEIMNVAENDLSAIKRLERKIYTREDPDLISGQAMIEDIRGGNGLEYSVIAFGKRAAKAKQEPVAYLAAVEDETDEGDPSIYLEDIAVLPEAQGQGFAWEMLKKLIVKLKEKSQNENKPVLLDMHLRENSQRLFERHQDELEQMGVTLIEEALIPDYYGDGEDALYKVYEIKVDIDYN